MAQQPRPQGTQTYCMMHLPAGLSRVHQPSDERIVSARKKRRRLLGLGRRSAS
jgi:hypothetical protein